MKNFYKRKIHLAADSYVKNNPIAPGQEAIVAEKGFNAGADWLSEKALEPILDLVKEIDRMRQAQKTYFSHRTDKHLKEAKRTESRVDYLVNKMREEGLLPPAEKGENLSQSGLF